jgi:hypothetical protein
MKLHPADNDRNNWHCNCATIKTLNFHKLN